MAVSRIRLVGAAQGFNWLPVFVAIERGLFAREGIEVELQKLGGVDKATRAVLDGEAELAITPPEGAISDCVAGGQLRIVASNSNRLPMTLVARPGIASLSDLRGKTIGTSSLTEGTAIYTQIMLANAGLAYPGDYDFALAGIHTTRWDAMQKGEIDAAPQPAPWNFLAADAGYAMLGEVSDAIPEIIFAALIGSKPWIDANPALVDGVLRALAEAHDIVNDPANEDACVPAFRAVTTKDDAGLARRGFVYMRDMGMWPPALAVTDRALATSIDLMIRTGLLDANARDAATGAYDRAPLRRALAS